MNPKTNRMRETYIHGTTYENAMSILASKKFNNPGIKTVWNCSNPDMLYLNKESGDEYAYCSTMESALIAAAKFDSKSKYIAVIRFTMEKELADKLIKPDDSCENADSWQIDKEELDRHIADGSITCEICFHDNTYVPYMRVFYLATVASTHMDFNDPLLETAIRTIKYHGIFIRKLFEFDEIPTETISLSRKEHNACPMTTD